MNQNVMAGTENLLRVENILKKTKLPTKEEMDAFYDDACRCI